jgi:small subunit ribosomal protein S17
MPAMKKTKVGQVLSNKMDKTVVVVVESHRHHPIYKKNVRKLLKYLAHDEKGECSYGDTVRIVETRPLSRLKRWRVSEIISKGAVIEVKPEEIEPKLVTEEEKPAEAVAPVEAAAAPEAQKPAEEAQK